MCKGKIKSFQADDKKLFYKLRKNIYHKKKILGEGSFGKVILVEKKDDIGSCNSKKFALKISKRFVYISKKDSSVISSEEEDEIPEGINFIELRELIIMKKIRHPNVIHLRDYKLCRKARAVWILMDYLPTELGTFFLKNKENKDIMNEKFFKNIAYQILNGVNYLHKKGIIHRDLKLENIFYDDVKKVVRIGDFGLSRLINYDLSCQYTDVGTYPYKPPELILGLKNYSFTFDIWSIGCILVEICTGCHLFGENDAIGVLKLMYEIFGSFNYTMLPKLKSFPYSKILENLPEKKGIGLVNYIKSKQKFDFENELFFDFIEKMLCIDPEKRVTAKECLNHPWLANIDISKIYLKNKNE